MKLSFIVSIVILLIEAWLVYNLMLNPYLGLGIALACTIPLAMD